MFIVVTKKKKKEKDWAVINIDNDFPTQDSKIWILVNFQMVST